MFQVINSLVVLSLLKFVITVKLVTDWRNYSRFKSFLTSLFNWTVVGALLAATGFFYNIQYDEKKVIKFKAGKTSFCRSRKKLQNIIHYDLFVRFYRDGFESCDGPRLAGCSHPWVDFPLISSRKDIHSQRSVRLTYSRSTSHRNKMKFINDSFIVETNQSSRNYTGRPLLDSTVSWLWLSSD